MKESECYYSCLAIRSELGQHRAKRQSQQQRALNRYHDWRNILLTAAGMTREAEDSVMREHVVWATAAEKDCSLPSPLVPRCTNPPKRKHIPITRSKLDKMEPSIDDCTTTIWPSFSATMLTCNMIRIVSSDVFLPQTQAENHTDGTYN